MIQFLPTSHLKGSGYTLADAVGFLPEFLSEADERSATEQFHTSYAHGGGWRPFKKFEMVANRGLLYPGDPVQYPIAEAHLRYELILVYPNGWVAVIQPTGEYEVCRMD